ncbi:MAG: chloramphenicol acetyltransferase [Anaerolineales bacterium]|nr:chloramphenicol acetyltransferase [Anaerolineales bacterium]
MREIDLETWPRRNHFKLFQTMDYPHFNLSANVDITAFRPYLKKQNVSFTIGVMYLIARVANNIPEFRTRIRGDKVVEHEVVHPSTTILTDDDLFTYCSVRYSPDFAVFTAEANKRIAEVREHPKLDDEDWADTLLFMTSLPWVSFTGMMHPLNMSPLDSVPRFAWGKFFNQGEQLKLPFNVQGHHGMMDGVHIGRFFEQFQQALDKPEAALLSASA